MVWLTILACKGEEVDLRSDDTGTAPFEAPDWCPELDSGRNEVTTTTDASPYYIQQPDDAEGPLPLILFLPGGNGQAGTGGHAHGTWMGFFGTDDPRGFRIAMPYVEGSGYPNTNIPDVEAVLDEVLACWETDTDHVHLGGHSNGGYLTYNVVGPQLAPRLASITGAPGYFQRFDAEDFTGIPFHHAAGENDAEWLAAMQEAHELVQAAGNESQLTVWPDTEHSPDENWTGRDGMFEFWQAH